ncbi:MAG TPA: hypothetical protein VMZ29_16655 [Candidatus Bathyarchaeia archaeon]|nr:hypothetical protein [Candidatus Bathyarchaeia archaeon]
MVEPPRLRVQFDAREKIIPLIIEQHCKGNYKLNIVKPEKEIDPKPGPIRRPTFQVLDTTGELVAFFNPWGGAECYKTEFKHFFEKMVAEIEKAAKDALAEFEGI